MAVMSANLNPMGSPNIQSESLRKQAIAWDDGCASDPIRNEFVVPESAALIARYRPHRILDIGAGTGYIARAIDILLNYRPEWVLIDLDEERLKVAQERKPDSMRMQCVVGDAIEVRDLDDTFQAVIITFTLLEAESVGAILEAAVSFLADDGILILAVPDVWADVIADPQEAKERSRRMLNETVSLHKIDKFTGQPYPFHAMRTESLISLVLERACILETLHKGGPQGDVYVLGFRKQRPLKNEKLCG